MSMNGGARAAVWSAGFVWFVCAACGGCDGSPSGGSASGGGGSALPQGPTSSLGKARQSARDVAGLASEGIGGQSKEAVIQRAEGKIEAARERIEGSPGAAGVAEAGRALAAARAALSAYERSSGEGAAERAALDRALASLEAAVATMGGSVGR